MKLPDWTNSGLLPFGLHQADVPGIYERLVLDAPHRERRELLFGALMRALETCPSDNPGWPSLDRRELLRKRSEAFLRRCIVIKPADIAALDGMPPEGRTQLTRC